MRMDGLDVVVTGGTGALGDAVIGALLEVGARLHVPWIEQRELAAFRHSGAVALTKVDVSDERQVSEYFRSLPGLYASIHLAGGFAMAPLVETTGADFERLLHLNGVSCFLSCREAVRAMRRTSGFAQRGGRIVNVGARPVVRPAGGMVAYSASKSVVASISESLGEELRDEGILVNAVLPSIMDTPANRAAMPTANHAAWPQVAQVAEAIRFLASPANALTSGALVPVFGRG